MSTKIRRVRATSLPSNPRPDTLYEVGGRLYLGGVAVSAGGGGARLTPPVAHVETPVTPEQVTITWGPSADGAVANTEYAALGAPTYRFDRAVDLAASLRRVELDGLIRADRVEENLGTRLDFSLGATTTTPYFVQGSNGAVVFMTTSATVTLVSYPNSALTARILVDGRRMPGSDVAGRLTGPVATTAGRPNWVTLTFADERPRVISYAANSLRSIILAAGRYAAPPRVARPKLLIAGDSFAQRFGAVGEVTPFGSLASLAGSLAGLNTVNIAQGGTGWVSTSSNTRYNYRQGLAWLAANAPGYAPDYLLCWGSGNDLPQVDQVQQQVTDTLREALTYWPNLKRVIVTGVYGGFNTETAALSISQRIKAGLDAVNDSRIVYVPSCASETDDPLYTGTGSVPDPKGDGNADFYFSSTAQGAGDRHPNRAGVVYGAEWLARRLYASITGAPL